jgi:hypothetical protein
MDSSARDRTLRWRAADLRRVATAILSWLEADLRRVVTAILSWPEADLRRVATAISSPEIIGHIGKDRLAGRSFSL